jgi:hypothetical protein
MQQPRRGIWQKMPRDVILVSKTQVTLDTQECNLQFEAICKLNTNYKITILFH